MADLWLRKEIKFYRLIGPVGFGVPEETVTAVRTTLATALSHWVQGGLDEAIDHLLALSASEAVAVPVAIAIRAFSPSCRMQLGKRLWH